mmetsp:Transcript_20745/g.45599  ORF Transcript_20745/g.45599 Transcript_20745/m.45599 type:complete len:201 (+) Transcript_20745:2167-2769(+)
MAPATQRPGGASARRPTRATPARLGTAQASSRRARTATATVSALAASASVNLAGAYWRAARSSTPASTKSARPTAAATGNASGVSAGARRAGLDQPAANLTVPWAARTEDARCHRFAAQGSASAMTAGLGRAASAKLSSPDFEAAPTTAPGMAFVWMATAPATSASRAQTAVALCALQADPVQTAIWRRVPTIAVARASV